MTGPLAGLRIVATLPPHGWFGGVDYNFAVEMADELRTLGATVFDLHVIPKAVARFVAIRAEIAGMIRWIIHFILSSSTHRCRRHRLPDSETEGSYLSLRLSFASSLALLILNLRAEIWLWLRFDSRE